MLAHTSRLFERFRKQVNELFKLPPILTMPLTSRANASSQTGMYLRVSSEP
jgi:hypothetical protein